MASEFHPDKNKTLGASKQFILIKESFEQIKQQHGKSIKMTYEQTHSPRQDFKSVRPNSGDYKEDFEKESEEQDYKKYQEFSH